MYAKDISFYKYYIAPLPVRCYETVTKTDGPTVA